MIDLNDLPDGTRVQHRTGDVGTIRKRANWQSVPGETLYLVHFDSLNGIRGITVKITPEFFDLVSL